MKKREENLATEKAIEHYTYDDYCLREGKWDLIEGMPMAMTPSPTINHQAPPVIIHFPYPEEKTTIVKCCTS